MSPQVTFKSSEDKVPQPGVLVDSAGKPVGAAPRLSDAVRPPYTPSHGRAPKAMPQPPVGLEDLGPAAALRVVGPDREKWLQGMQSNDLAAAPHGGAVAGVFLGGKGRLVSEALLWRQPEEVIVTVEPVRLDALEKHLDSSGSSCSCPKRMRRRSSRSCAIARGPTRSKRGASRWACPPGAPSWTRR